MGNPIRALDAGTVRIIGPDYLGVAKPYDITIVATVMCVGCHKPHLVEVASSARNPDAVVSVLSLAIIDVIDTYSIIPDEEHASWRHE